MGKNTVPCLRGHVAHEPTGMCVRNRSASRQLLSGIAMLVALLVLGCSRIVPPPASLPTQTWQTVSPEDVSWSRERLELARAFAEETGSGPVMVVVHGRVVVDWGETDRKFHVASVRKSLASALIGQQVQDGTIDLASTLDELGIDDSPLSLTSIEKQATVGDLLTMRSGVYHVAESEPPEMGLYRPARGSHAPGSWYHYNNWDSNVLGTIFEQRSQTTIGEAFLRRIADPLQMQDFEATDVRYVQTGRSMHPGFPFRMTARDLARFGLLYLRKGDWGGKQVVPSTWVAESTARQVRGISMIWLTPTPLVGLTDIGYGYQWWVEREGRL
jgi:CubicO group peptidase (beta-lactamase class C family)